MEIKFPIGNVTSKEMFIIKSRLEKIGFDCNPDKKGHFVCYPGEGFDKYKIKVDYDDGTKTLRMSSYGVIVECKKNSSKAVTTTLKNWNRNQ